MPDRSVLVRSLAPQETISVRLDTSLELQLETAPVGKPRWEADGSLEFRRGKTVTARVTGAAERLALLEELLGGREPEDLAGVLLPRDPDAFGAVVQERTDEVARLLAEGRQLVEQVERLVCALYAVPDDLTEAVIAHAAVRAAK